MSAKTKCAIKGPNSPCCPVDDEVLEIPSTEGSPFAVACFGFQRMMEPQGV